MIRAAAPGFAAIARRLALRARQVAETQAESRLRERQGDPSRWRNARLLWPDLMQER